MRLWCWSSYIKVCQHLHFLLKDKSLEQIIMFRVRDGIVEEALQSKLPYSFDLLIADTFDLILLRADQRD